MGALALYMSFVPRLVPTAWAAPSILCTWWAWMHLYDGMIFSFLALESYVLILGFVVFRSSSRLFELCFVMVAGAVVEAFVRLHEKGLIYQGKTLNAMESLGINEVTWLNGINSMSFWCLFALGTLGGNCSRFWSSWNWDAIHLLIKGICYSSSTCQTNFQKCWLIAYFRWNSICAWAHLFIFILCIIISVNI